MVSVRILLTIAAIFCYSIAFAGGSVRIYILPPDTSLVDSAGQKDIIDVLQTIFSSKSGKANHPAKKVNISVVPTLGYTLSTGFAVGLSGVATFYTQKQHTGNESVINVQAFYDSHSQQTLHDGIKYLGR